MRRVLPLVALLTLLPGGATASADLPPQWRPGVAITAFWWQDLGGRSFETQLVRARDGLRVQEVTFVTSWYQWFTDLGRKDQLNAVEIHDSPGSERTCRGQTGRDFRRCKTPSLDVMGRAVRRAKARGLRVGIRPQVDVGRRSTQLTQRDLIDHPPQRRRPWFDAYKRMLSQYARLARDTRADVLYLGAGLSGMTNDEADREEWRSMAREVRTGELMGDGRGGFAGELTYAAQWDAVVQDAEDPFEGLGFWDVLDSIQVDAYFPLVSGGNGDPSTEALRVGWTTAAAPGLPRPPAEVLRRLQAEWGKPLRLTLGYSSRTGTASFPEKPDHDLAKAGGVQSERPQARAVNAAFDVWAPIAAEGWFRGIDWWEWPAGGRSPRGDGSFSVIGKAAQETICRRHGGARQDCAKRRRAAARSGRR